MAAPNRNPLEILAGQELDGITFIKDYIQLHFDSPVLNAYTLPKVLLKGHTLQFGDPGYRDALCERIGVMVQHAGVDPNIRIFISFADGSMFIIPLDADSYTGPEAAEFTDRIRDPNIWVVF